MNIFKIIIGFLLLFSIGREYASASKQLGSFFSPGILIAMFAMLIFATWLIGSGFSKRKLRFKSIEFIKFFSISLVIFASFTLYGLLSLAVPDNYKTINGINIPMNKCIDGSIRLIPDKIEREEYCYCLAEKITNDSKLNDKFKNDLERGRLMKILNKIKEEGHIMKFGFSSCMNNVEMKWTDNMANSLKSQWKEELHGTFFEQTNDIEIYCDCLLTEYKKHPFGKIVEEGFQESELYILIEDECTEKSKR